MLCHNTHLTTHAGYIVCTQYNMKHRSSAPYVVHRSRYMRPPHKCGVPCCTKCAFQHMYPTQCAHYGTCTLSKWYTCCLHVPEATHTSCYAHTPPAYFIPDIYHLNVPYSVDHLGYVFIYTYSMLCMQCITNTSLYARMPCILHHTYLIS